MKYIFKKKRLNFFMGLFDFFGRILFFPGWIKRPLSENPERIAILRFDHIGDIINTTPLLRSLRKKYKNAEIDIYVSPWGEEAIAGNPRVDNVFVIKTNIYERDIKTRIGFGSVFGAASVLRRRKYSLGISVRGDAREIFLLRIAGVRHIVSYGITGCSFMADTVPEYNFGTHEIDINLNIAGALDCPELSRETEFFVREEDNDIRRLFGLESGKYFVFHVGSGASSKRWHPYKFARLISMLKDDTFKIVLAGSSAETGNVAGSLSEKKSIVDLGGKTTLSQLGAVLRHSVLFLGTDSGPAHIAAALKVPSIVLFSGSNLPSRWAPRGGNVKVIYKNTP
ncbi:MAG: glycosyltransferase family 9 protein, partial [bacterium]|nr:glycosyltransferase family 9 protein [bacterium]